MFRVLGVCGVCVWMWMCMCMCGVCVHVSVRRVVCIVYLPLIHLYRWFPSLWEANRPREVGKQHQEGAAQTRQSKQRRTSSRIVNCMKCTCTSRRMYMHIPQIRYKTIQGHITAHAHTRTHTRTHAHTRTHTLLLT